jgi:hypothetical protein
MYCDNRTAFSADDRLALSVMGFSLTVEALTALSLLNVLEAGLSFSFHPCLP